MLDASGAAAGTLTIGSQSFKGVWSKPLHTFLSLDGSFGGITALDEKGRSVLTVANILLNGDSDETSPGLWDQEGSIKVSDLKVTDDDEGVVVTIAELAAGTTARAIDMKSFQEMMEKMEAAAATVESSVSVATAPGEEDAGATAEGDAPADPNASADQGEGQAGDVAETPSPDDFTMPSDVPASELTPEQTKALDDMMLAMQGIPSSIGDASSNIALRGLSVRDSSGAEQFKLDSVSLDFGITGLDKEKSGMRFAYSHAGLDADWNIFNEGDDEYGDYPMEGSTDGSTDDTTEAVPEVKPEPLDAATEQLIDGLAPREFVLDIRLEDVPSTELWKTFVTTFYSGAPSSPTGMEMEMMGAMLPMMLAQAGSNVRIVDSRIVSQLATLTLDGTVKADAASMMGASGSITAEVTGLDAVIDQVKAYVGPEGAADTAPLEMLRAFSERTQAEGKTVDRYLITLEPNGALMLNGKDITFLLGMGGETPPGEGEMPMEGEMPAPDAEAPQQ
jgi:hypothetical protein